MNAILFYTVTTMTSAQVRWNAHRINLHFQVSINRIPSYKVKLDHYNDKVWQWLVAGRWFSPGTPVSSTNKTDRHDITEIL
jgi:hypothetical protein